MMMRHSQVSPSLSLRPASSSALPPFSVNRSRPRLGRGASVNRSIITPCAAVVEPGELVLVAGATGGVGQLVTAKLLEVGERRQRELEVKKKPFLFFFFCSTLALSISID